ncbi:MAG TPA: 2-oxoglutarate dehydrogenase complex dihydrolipoyllysine-residue succinyltransferase [Alphaproteobacteria bacterium]|nr:2-oxoglutarate dehydrogenase complex dihydrolipoyllysine-residue succinyltransferase [Alphaproteobacteria bacterium]
MALEILVPTLGESVTEATVAKWFKAVGEAVAADEPLLELETDKVTLEVNAASAGVLSEILANEGAEVEVGALLGRIDENGTSAKPKSNGGTPAAKSNGGDAPATAPATAAASSGEAVSVVVPTLGESVTEATVAKWFKAVGEAVNEDEALLELETDKVTLEVNAPAAGTLAEITAEEGATVEVGALLGKLAAGAVAAMAKAPEAKAAAPVPAQTSGDDVMPMPPSVQKLVAEHGLDPAQIAATGKGGRLTKGDVLAFIEKGGAAASAPAPATAPAAKPAAPSVPFAPDARGPDSRGEERVRMTRLRQRIAERLKEAQNTAAMLTTFNEVDMGAVMELRSRYKETFEKKHGTKLGFMSFFAKACVLALKELPAVNAQIEGDEIIYKNYYDIGVAVGTEQGLVVPVVRDVDKKSFAEIEATITDLGLRARDGKLTMDELTGGTYTITNGGIYGSLMSTPILNPPQSGILGMHKIQPRPMAVGDKVEVRPMMYLAMSYDHRIVDGREAVTFLVRVKEAIEDPQRILLDM